MVSSLQSDMVKKCMLRLVRQQAGLGCPPDAFKTNASERVNASLKNKVDYKRHELPVFLDKLREAIVEQDVELSRAVIGCGKYEVQPGFQRKVCKQEEDWFMRMKESDRARHMKMVASLKVFQADEDEALISVNQAGPSGLCGGVSASGCGS